MYFWRIDNLKRDLIAGRLPQNEQFKYLLAGSVLFAAATIPFVSSNWFDVVNGVCVVVLVGIGTYYIYWCNGGKNGEWLLERYISLGWVVFIRWGVLILVPAIVVYYVGYELVVGVPDATGIPDIVFTVLVSFVYYYLLGKHVRGVAEQAT